MHALLLTFCWLVVTLARSSASLIDLIENPHVKIKARLQVVPNQYEFLIQEIELLETYSNVNGRSLIEIKSPYNNDRTVSFYATKDGSKIEYDPAGATCHLAETKEYLETLFGPHAVQNIDLINHWLSPIDGIPGHSIGLGRLLALIQARKIKPKQTTAMQNIRGNACFGYSFVLQWAKNLELTVHAFHTHNLNDSDELQHPIRLIVKFKERAIFMLDIFAIETKWMRPHGTLNHLDATTLPLGVACAAVQKARMASEKVPLKTIFSLEAELVNHEQLEMPKKQFIAFDANQQALRRDTLSNSNYLKNIYDLRRARRYNMNSVSGDGQRNKHDAEKSMLRVDEAPVRECVAAELEKGDYEQLMPFEELAYAGIGLVRGRKVDIFEMSSKTLPALFFPQSRFLDMNDKWQLHEAKVPQKDHEYQVAYYFAGDDAHVEAPYQGTLVRVDIRRRRRLIKQINVFNFVWRLSQAPNGDAVESLFSLHHTCSSVFQTSSMQLTYAPDKSIHMSMELEFLLTTPQNGNSSSLDQLQNAPLRNAAILRGLLGSAKSLSPVQFVDLRSFLKTLTTNQTSQHTLLVSSQIGLVDDDFFRPKMVSHGWIYPSFEPIRSISSFEECFNEASRRRKSERVLFAFTDIGFCYIDAKPVFETKTDNDAGKGDGVVFTYSNIFGLEKNESAVKVMAVELIEKVESRQSKQVAWSQIKSDLMQQSITLPLVLPETMGEVTIRGFFFRVAKMEMSDQLEGHTSGEVVSYDGIGLQSGHKLTLVDESIDGTSCRSACVKDMECRSYSICLIDRQVECVVSGVDFANSKTATRLEEQRELMHKQKSAQKVFSLKLESQSDIGDQSVVLKLDRRCRLVKKFPVEMFTELPKTRTSLSKKLITQVDNEQECAERCLQINIKYLKDMAESSKHSTQPEAWITAKRNFRRNLKNWCAIFKFFDLERTLAGKNLVKNGLLNGVSKSGLCMLPRRLAHDGENARQEDDVVIESKVSLEMNTFTFSYINLFELGDNVRMISYSASDDDTNETSSANSKKVVEMKSVEECARACFMQTTGLIPFCKSFESVELQESKPKETSPGDWQSQEMIVCSFNSMSLTEAKQAGIYEKVITIKPDPLVVSKHYEPRKDHLLNEKIIRDFLTAPIQAASLTEASHKMHFVSLVLLMFVAVSGFLAGAILKDPLVKLWTERNDQPIRPRRLSQNPSSL